MTRTVRRLAGRLARQNRRQSRVLERQAQNEMAFACLQPWPENDRTRYAARQKREKARRLKCMAAQFERVTKNGTGPGGSPRPVVARR